MEKGFENLSYNHSINLNERKSIYITGVVKIANFDDEEFFLETNMGNLTIKGQGLEMLKLDTKDGVVSIKGTIDSLQYSNKDEKKENKSSLLDKLFKWFYKSRS